MAVGRMREGEEDQSERVEAGREPPRHRIAAEPIIEEAGAEGTERGDRAGRGEQEADETPACSRPKKSATSAEPMTDTPPYENPKRTAAM